MITVSISLNELRDAIDKVVRTKTGISENFKLTTISNDAVLDTLSIQYEELPEPRKD